MAPAPATASRVILVDDAAAVRGMLRALLVDEGFNVVGDFPSGGHLLTAVEKLHPDIVCLDYNLPDINGLDLLKLLHEAHPVVAVVMITGSDDKTLEQTAAAAGASGFIRKPFSPDRIVKELRQVLHARRLLGDAAAQEKVVSVKTARARAVIADDSATIRLLLKTILERAAVAVVGEAADGKQVVDLAAQHSPDIICLDIDMPVMNGLDALVAIHAAQPAAKVLMITGSTSRDAILQAGKAGARGYILKPFQPDKVMAAIDKLLG